MDNTPNVIDRRNFMKLAAVGAVGAAVGGCGPQASRLAAKRDVPADKMTYRVDPKTGAGVSLLGFGMMRLPRVARAQRGSLPDTNDLDQEAINELVDYAIAHGVNLFDTSPAYCKGFSETATGIALSRHDRSKYFISTKLSNQREWSREGSLNIYKRSFEYLRTDYIDYYLVHNVGTHDNFKGRYIDNGMLDFLMAERDAGRIRSLGWSFHGEGEFFDYLMSGKYKWDFVLIQMNYLDWNKVIGRTSVNARHQYETLMKMGVPAMIMEPLLGGRLAMPHYKARELMTQADPGASAASWAFRFAGTFPNVLTVLSGMTFMDHLQDNIRTYAPLEPLMEEEYWMLEKVAEIAEQYRNINCTACQYCMPCPYGLDIPGIITHFNRSLNEGNFPDDKQSVDYKRARRAFLVGLDRGVAPIRQASRCTGCKECTKNCPQRIDIPGEMERIDRFTETLRLYV
ncbi:MAG: aldo/keto reductase [Chitinispirillales bacterium]|jgi:predicted aldo/keto reductase-like oxidoreductase|nr:aldo/keto reductase [Chitinispirillales bacterium]